MLCISTVSVWSQDRYHGIDSLRHIIPHNALWLVEIRGCPTRSMSRFVSSRCISISDRSLCESNHAQSTDIDGKSESIVCRQTLRLYGGLWEYLVGLRVVLLGLLISICLLLVGRPCLTPPAPPWIYYPVFSYGTVACVEVARCLCLFSVDSILPICFAASDKHAQKEHCFLLFELKSWAKICSIYM